MFRSTRRLAALATLLVGLLLPACSRGPEGEPVTVNAREYAFEGLPGTLDAGPYSFTVANQGSEVHELQLFRVEDAAPSSAELQSMPDNDLLELLERVGAASADPDDNATFDAELESGRYLAVCFVPVGTTPDEGHEGHEMEGEAHELGPDAHFRKGMSAELTVT